MSEEFRAIRPGELEECLDLWGIVFERVGRGYFPPYFNGDPWFRRAYTRVCAVDGKLVSAVQICKRRVRVGGAELVMGGIGNVGTLPEYRGRGYSNRLMWDTVKVMRRHGMDFSVLFTGIQSFYEKALWRSVPQKYLHAEGISLERTPSAYKMRTSDWESDLASLEAIYQSLNEGRSLTTIRTNAYWRGYLHARFGDPEYCLIAESEGKSIGYLAFGYDKPTCWPREIGWLPGHEGCVRPLFEEMIAVCPDRGAAPHDSKVEKLSMVLPHEPAIMDAINALAKKIEEREPMGGMFRIINIRSLGERLLPELNRRGAPDGSISMDTELGSLRLTVKRGRVSLGAEKPIGVPLSQLEFFCLVFGITSVEELGLDSPANDILGALFPPRKFVFWPADHF